MSSETKRPDVVEVVITHATELEASYADLLVAGAEQAWHGRRGHAKDAVFLFDAGDECVHRKRHREKRELAVSWWVRAKRCRLKWSKHHGPPARSSEKRAASSPLRCARSPQVAPHQTHRSSPSG